jgi:hypothetical protein
MVRHLHDRASLTAGCPGSRVSVPWRRIEDPRGARAYPKVLVLASYLGPFIIDI